MIVLWIALLVVSSIALILAVALWSVIKDNNRIDAENACWIDENAALLARLRRVNGLYRAARDGLTAVQNLRTGKMANIGHRMYEAARKADSASLDIG